jgi:predicted Zn-dependent protease
VRIFTLAAIVLALGFACRLAASDTAASPGPAPGETTSAAATSTPAAESPPTAEDKADAEIGKSAAAEVEKQYQVLDDPADLARISTIIEQVRPFTQKPKQTYTAKIVGPKDPKAGPEINAFSLPGGYLYYTKGLIDAVESDDELAAVTGHEMGHVCLNHARKLMSKDERYSKLLTPIVLASILAQSKSVDPGAVAVVGSLVLQDALNSYGREAEAEADASAVRYLYASKRYNPVAVLTVVEGLAHIQARQAPLDLGVYQTHPDPAERVASVTRALEELKVPIERRRVTKGLAASAGPIVKDGKEIGELRLSVGGSGPQRVVYQPAAECQGLSPVARAQQSAEIMNAMLLSDLQLLEISSVPGDRSSSVQARATVILTITAADAEFHKSTVDALSKEAMQAVRAAFEDERLKRVY